MISPLESHLARSLVRAAVKRAEREHPGDEPAQHLQVGENLMEAITEAIELHERAQRPSYAAYNEGHAAGLVEAEEVKRRAVKRARAGEFLTAWATPDHRRVYQPACSQRDFDNGLLIAVDGHRAVATAYGSNVAEMRHWLAYRLGLCPRPEVGS